MNSEQLKVTLVIAGVLVVYSVGYSKGKTRTLRKLASYTSNEALYYLAAQDYIKHKSD